MDSELPKTTEQMVAQLRDMYVTLAKEINDLKAGKASATDQTNIAFYEELRSIKGIGPETARDIIGVFPDRESLLQSLKNGQQIPFRNDIVKKLKDKIK